MFNLKRILALVCSFYCLTATALTCPDMSQTSKIPSGWYSLWYMEYSPPAKHNTFLAAKFLMTLTLSAQPVTCTYIPEGKTVLNTFTLQSRSHFPMPTGENWYSHLFSKLQICDGPYINDCSF